MAVSRRISISAQTMSKIMSKWNLLFISWITACVATAGSLFFSEVMNYPPCSLCWYQRILLYPLVLIFGVGLWTEDASYKKYVYPMAGLGLAVAAYHNLLYFGIISEELAPCTQELSCTNKQLELFGFLTIPLLSLFGFLMIMVLTWLDSRVGEKYEK